MKPYTITYHLNLKGESCPYPAIRSIQALKELKAQEVLEVVSDCPQTLHTIPIDVKNYGYDLLEIIHNGEDIHYIIQKKA